jgi:hypothetical protein
LNDSLWVGVFGRFVYQYKEVKNSSRLSDEVTGIFNLISDQTLPHLPLTKVLKKDFQKNTAPCHAKPKNNGSLNMNPPLISSMQTSHINY